MWTAGQVKIYSLIITNTQCSKQMMNITMWNGGHSAVMTSSSANTNKLDKTTIAK